ncbi:MAG: hypothetical protein AAFQ27_04495 [Pseudomonadota bacterium]
MRKLTLSAAITLSFAALTSIPIGLSAENTAQADTCDATSLDSVPGRAWNEAYGWRFNTSTDSDPKKRAEQNRANREAAYTALVKGQSPWPSWFTPSISVIRPGTRFQMAMSKGQRDDQPGGFGTFDEIDTVNEVREDLAVLLAWKADVDRINTYVVTDLMMAHVGPIGPQVDPKACKLLPGRFSQFEMLVRRDDRMKYIKFVSSEKLKQPDKGATK